MTMQCLASRGQSRRQIARLLGCAESTVRYHLERQATGAQDGRLKPQLAEGWGEAVAAYLEAGGEGPVNLAALHAWLVEEHDYTGSLRSVQRYFRKHYPKPKRRARRRVETPPGAQAQADWAEWPRVWIADQAVYAYQFFLQLSHSRFTASAWSPRKDQLAWHYVHNLTLERLGGVPATIRVDNEKTVMSRGAGPWGELNPAYRRYAKGVRFHIDVCEPYSPWQKGKAERRIRTERGWEEVTRRRWESWDELQAYSDSRMLAEAHRRTCPATGTSVFEAWEAEKAFLAPLPLLPEPFDVAVTRKVAGDCTVGFEGRRYSVPFAWMDKRVEVRGCARVVQVAAAGSLLAEHPRQGRERIVIDPRHYEGEATHEILPPVPLGRMGRRLAAIAAMAPQQRPLDLYAALAEAAR